MIRAILAAALMLTSLSATAHADALQRFYLIFDNSDHHYASRVQDGLANIYADRRYGRELVNDSRSWIKNDVKHAWIRGYTGEGVNISVIDNFRNPYYTDIAHGDVVSAIVGGRGSVAGMDTIGIAADANVRRIDRAAYHNGRRSLTGYGEDIINISASDRSVRIPSNPNNALITKSAGNDGCTIGGSCNRSSQSLVSQHGDNVLVVGALAKDGAINHYSNRAGSVSNNFVVDDGWAELDTQVNYYQWRRGEDGWDRVVTGSTSSYYTAGTSFSAPRVAGKAAIIKSKFRNLDGAGIANIIKTTADDLGAPGVDSVYGHGRVNLTRALSPVGGLR